MASPACLTVNSMIGRPRRCASSLRKRDWRNSFWSAFSTGQKSSPSPWVARCTKYQYCWRDMCRPVYAACGCLCATPSILLTPPAQSYTFFLGHSTCGVASPTYPPKYLIPVKMVRPRPQKNLSSCVTL